MDTTMSLWISNNTCLAVDAMLPVLQSGELCAAHAHVLMNINTSLFGYTCPSRLPASPVFYSVP